MIARHQRSTEPADPARRGLLRWLATGLLGLVGVAGCRTQERPRPEPATVPLADIPAGGRLRALHRGVPVELRRTGPDVAARSLLCTHWGCEVQWSEEERKYLCPCHDGVFDENGGVVGGPPTRPLATYAVTVEDGIIRLGDDA